MNKNIFDISDTAITQIKKILKEHDNKLLKVSVKSGGCSGFTYDMSMIDEKEIIDDDEIINKENIKIIVDGASILYLIGTELDYQVTLIGSQFVFNNPNSKSKCGCEKSFSV